MHIFLVRKPQTQSMTNSVFIHSQGLWNKLNYPTWLKQKLSVPSKSVVLKPSEGQFYSQLRFRK